MTYGKNRTQVGIILPAPLQREVLAYCQAHDLTPATYIEALVRQFEEGTRAAACHFSDSDNTSSRLSVSLPTATVDFANEAADLLASNNRRYRGPSFLADLIAAAHAKTFADIQNDRGRVPTDFTPTTDNLSLLEWPEGTSKVVAPMPTDSPEIEWKPRRGRPRGNGTPFILRPFPVESWQLGVTPDEAAHIIHDYIKEHPRLEYVQQPAAWMRLAEHHLAGVKLIVQSATEKRRLYRFMQLCETHKQPWTWAKILNERMAEARKERRSTDDATN